MATQTVWAQYLHKHTEVVLQGLMLEGWVVHSPPLASIFIVGVLNGVVSYQRAKQVKHDLCRERVARRR